MEIYYLLVVASAGIGGYLLGVDGKDSNTGRMSSLLAALIFAVPMGLWLLFNIAVYLLKDGYAGFAPNDVRETGGLLAVGVSVWFCGLCVGWLHRIRAKR